MIFDTIAREWRCKWSEDEDKKSLTEAQKVIEETLPKIKALDGLKSVQRVVCGDCKDLKLIIAFSADKFDKLAEADLEDAFLEAWKGISYHHRDADIHADADAVIFCAFIPHSS